MPICASILRLLRRRAVLGLILGLSIIYCGFSLFHNESKSFNPDNDSDDMDGIMLNDNNDDLINDNDSPAENLRSSAKSWQLDNNNAEINDNELNADVILNGTSISSNFCRNSIQGKVLIVDEHGMVCARQNVLPNGCCNTEIGQALKADDSASLTIQERYSCKTCNAQGCCAVYEYCVSCCLNPQKLVRGKKSLDSSTNHKENLKNRRGEDIVRLRLRNLDRFQICLAVCRTSSASVRHENTYKDPHSKHCYSLQPLNSYQRHRRDLSFLNNNGNNQVVAVTSSSGV
ncbi:SREBP regulating gene protein [Prorops nasuta]|uniref:SREBP regulating gene protein n=1 Tax=Prorops nasuta TaxID=863751 RepID=UPI0034CD4FEC